jgi:hypothetical protein
VAKAVASQISLFSGATPEWTCLGTTASDGAAPTLGTYAGAKSQPMFEEGRTPDGRRGS